MTNEGLNEQIARRLFGWKWIAYKGMPVRGHPEYPKDDIYVRQFFSPQCQQGELFKKFCEDREAKPATGDEPLSYSYCSSVGPEHPPYYAKEDDYEVLLYVRGLPPSSFRDAFKKRLGNQWSYTRGTYSRAALKALDDCEVDTYEELWSL